jgi:tryptophanyl-tRNA synthetase
MKTAHPIRGAKTDAERHISYDTERRREVANLLEIAALCLERPPEQIADQIADRGASALKHLVADALDEHLRPIRAHRAEPATRPRLPRSVLHNGNDRSREIASATLETVHELMHTTY